MMKLENMKKLKPFQICSSVRTKKFFVPSGRAGSEIPGASSFGKTSGFLPTVGLCSGKTVEKESNLIVVANFSFDFYETFKQSRGSCNSRFRTLLHWMYVPPEWLGFAPSKFADDS